MSYVKNFLSRTMVVMLMACIASFGALAVTDNVFAEEDDYEGTNIHIYHIDNGEGGSEQEIEVDNDELFADEVRNYKIVVDDPPSDTGNEKYFLKVDVSAVSYPGEDEQPTHELSTKAVYFDENKESNDTYLDISDNTEHTITVDGSECWNELKDHRSIYHHYSISIDIELVDKTKEGMLCNGSLFLTLHEPMYYDFENDDTAVNWTIPRGDSQFINKNGRVIIPTREDTYHEEDYVITDVTSEDTNIAVVKESDENDGWNVEGLSNGNTQLTVYYDKHGSDYSNRPDHYVINVEVVDGYYWVNIEEADGVTRNNILPGGEISLKAGAMYADAQGDHEADCDYEWKILEGKDIASIEVDENDGSKATLKVKDEIEFMNPDIDEEQEGLESSYEINVSVKLKDKVSGEYLDTSGDYTVFVAEAFDTLHISDHNEYLFDGDTQEISTDFKHYDKNNKDGFSIDRNRYEITYEVDPEDAATVKDLGNGKYRIKRLTDESFSIEFKAAGNDSDYYHEKTLSFSNAPSRDLEDYGIRLVDVDGNDMEDEDGSIYIDDNDSLTPRFVLRGDVDIDPKEYTIKLEREIETDDGFRYEVVGSNVPIKTDEYGTATYRVTATAKSESSFSGSAEREFFFASPYSLYSPDVNVVFSGFDYENVESNTAKHPSEFYYVVSKDAVDTLERPVVTINRKELVENDDYTLSYVLEDDMGDTDLTGSKDIPKTEGTYRCLIKGTGQKGNGYYGIHSDVTVYVVSSEASIGAVNDALAFADIVENVFGFEDIDEMKEGMVELNKAKAALSAEAIAAIPEHINDMYKSIEKYIEFSDMIKTINVSKPDPKNVSKARAAYNAIPVDFRDIVKTDELNKLTAAENKIASDRAAAEARAKRAKAEAKAKTVKSVTVNVATVNAGAVNNAVKKAGGSNKYVTKIVLGNNVKTIKKGTFTSYKKVGTLEIKTKKLKKKSVKNCLKGSNIKTIKVSVGKKKANKAQIKKYKKIFTKKIVGKKVKLK